MNRVTGAKTLTLSDRPELRIDPTAIITTRAISNVSGAQVYSVEASRDSHVSATPYYSLPTRRLASRNAIKVAVAKTMMKYFPP